MFRGVFLDLDGTALNNHHELSTKTTETLRRLSKQGFNIHFATGRASSSGLKYVDQLNLDQKEVYTIFYNGSVGYKIQKSLEAECLFNIGIPEQHARILLDLASELGLVAQYYNAATGDIMAFPINDEQKGLMQQYATLVGNKQLICPYEEAIKSSQSAKILIMTKDPDHLITVCRERFPENMFHMIRGSPNPFFVEFLPFGISKGEAVRKICEATNIDPAQLVAFGDGENDKEMISLVGMGIAMKNGGSLAKAAAKAITELTNDEDGVAVHLEAMEREGLLCFR